jgi:hypothetical protein
MRRTNNWQEKNKQLTLNDNNAEDDDDDDDTRPEVTP